MVEISLSGSGEGPGGAISQGYSTSLKTTDVYIVNITYLLRSGC